MNSAQKRASGTHLLIPGYANAVYPDGGGIAGPERQAMAWCYSGIAAANPSTGANTAIFDYHYRMLRRD
jgi:hypothetical protein